MKRLNEYTAVQLECLQLLLSLAGMHGDEMGMNSDTDVYKFWAAEIDQAINDRKLEDELLPFPYNPSKN